MGASQSSGRGAAGVEEVEVKTSYYELLGVQRQAGEEDIKKAYRRKALELHPDRNYGNEETATRTFAEVQAAYEVLSDAQERAWYDSHESAILRGDDGQGADSTPTYQNVKITTADDLARMVRKFNTNVSFSDSPSGFFGFIRETFTQLAQEEEIAAQWENAAEIPDYPTFGHKEDAYDDVVKRFYASWSSFATVKSFAWRDKYKLSEAPDRWFRRRMEKENRAFRQEGIKEFNDAVRSLVAFVRKRDPRYIPSTQSEADRQKVLRDAAAAQAVRARAANLAKLDEKAVPEWTKVREPEEPEESEEEEVEEEVLECVACGKVFKSERQWEAHERSKKHQKAVYALQKKMRKQNAHLDLDDGTPVSSSQVSSGVVTPEGGDEEEVEVGDDDVVEAEVEEQEVKMNGHAQELEEQEDAESQEDIEDDGPRDGPAPVQETPNQPSSDSEDEDSDYASPETIQTRLHSTTLDTASEVSAKTSEVTPSQDGDKPDGETAQPKLGKAALKRAKKAAAAAVTEEAANAHKCATCNSSFPSKTRLFQHIKDHGHAAPKFVPAGTAGGGKGKRGKGKR